MLAPAAVAVEANCVRGRRRDAQAVPEEERSLAGGNAQVIACRKGIDPDPGLVAPMWPQLFRRALVYEFSY